MPAHHNNGLAHKEHEKAAQNRQNKDGDSWHGNYINAFHTFHPNNKFLDQEVIVVWADLFRRTLELLLNKIDNKARNLWRQNAEIVRNNNEQNPNAKADPVLPKIFV